MNKIKSLVAVLSLLILGSCKSDLQDLNTNPELLGQTDPRYVFTGATRDWNNCTRNHLMAKYSGVMQLMQYVVTSGGASEGIYANPVKSNNPAPFLPYYGDFFGSSNRIGQNLRYLVNVVIANHPEKERYLDVEAISNMLEAYQAWMLFDAYGTAPYEEAFRVDEGIKTPVYNYYQDLYKQFDETVKASIESLSAKHPNQYELGNNDFFYKGDIDKWVKFGNTLRIKMAQRLEKADNAHYNAVLNEVLSHSGGIISNNEESCIYYHPNEYNNNTDDICVLTYQYGAARSFVNFLTEYDDPRLPLLIRRNGFGPGNNNKSNDSFFELMKEYYPDYESRFSQWTGRYVGMSANPDSTQSLWSSDTYFTLPYNDGSDKTMTIRMNSQVESRFYIKNGGKIGTQITARDKEDATYDASENEITVFDPQITYAEVCFMMAEISLKSGSAKAGKDADMWFRDGIRASMEQYQVWAEKMKVPSAMANNSDNYQPIDAAKIEAYLARPEFQTATLEKIATQQWIHLFMRPEEAWASWKRTGLPAFKDQPDPVDGVGYLETVTTAGDKLLIPRRCIVPTPNSANVENFNQAIKKMLEDPNYGATANSTEGRIWWDRP